MFEFYLISPNCNGSLGYKGKWLQHGRSEPALSYIYSPHHDGDGLASQGAMVPAVVRLTKSPQNIPRPTYVVQILY